MTKITGESLQSSEHSDAPSKTRPESETGVQMFLWDIGKGIMESKSKSRKRGGSSTRKSNGRQRPKDAGISSETRQMSFDW